MAKYIMMCGVSGSGKSTHAYSYSLINGTDIVSTDDIRAELFGDASIQSNGDKVFSIAKDRIREHLLNGEDVIFDATNVKRKDRKKALEWVEDIPNVFKRCVVLDTSESVCINRQNNRYRKVPISVIERQAKNFTMPSYEEGFDEIMVLYPDGTGEII